MRYMNEAYNLFARRSMTIIDRRTPTITQFILREGVENYNLHPSIIEVLSARVEGDDTDLYRAGHGILDSRSTSAEDFHFGYRPSARQIVTPLTAFTTDEGMSTIRVYGTPTSDYNGRKVNLRVARMPTQALSLDNTGYVPEVPDQYHLAMLDWAAYLALSNHDADAENMTRAALRRKSFDDTIEQALLDVRRRRFPTTVWKFNAGYIK